MGRGNFIPNGYIQERGFDQVYIDTQAEFEDDNELNYELMKKDVANLLPTFRSVDKWEGSNHNEIHIIHENGLFQVGFADNECSTAVVVMVKEGAPAFAKANLQGFADSLFDKLADIYYMTVRCGPWMSAPYKKRLSNE